MWTEGQLAACLERLRSGHEEHGRWEWSQLDGADMELLVAAFQSRKRRFGPRRARLVEQASTYLAEISSEYCWHQARKRLSGRAGSGSRVEPDDEDLYSEAGTYALEQLDQYQATGQGNVFGFLSSRMDWFASDYARTTALSGTLDRPWHAVRSALGSVRQDYLAQHHREPSEAELTQAVREHMLSTEVSKLATQNPDWTEGMCRAEAESKMVRQGIRRALDDMPAIRMLTTDVYLDTPVSEGGLTYGHSLEAVNTPDTEATLDKLFALALGPHTWARAALAARFGAQDDIEGSAALEWERSPGKKTASLSRLADACGVEKSDLKDTLAKAVSRLGAPHAHWSYMTGGARPRLQEGPNAATGVGGFPREAFADR